jgi:hypothetical protein
MHEAQLRSIEMASGKVMWSIRGVSRTPLLMVDGHFIGVSEECELLLFKMDAKKCDLLSAIELRLVGKTNPARFFRPPCWAAPIVSHGLLYVRGSNRLLCLELIPESSGRTSADDKIK